MCHLWWVVGYSPSSQCPGIGPLRAPLPSSVAVPCCTGELGGSGGGGPATGSHGASMEVP